MICSQGGLIPSLSDANLTPSGPPRISPCGPDRLAIRVAADTVPSKSARKGARPQMPAAGRPGLIAEETSEHRRQRRCADDGTGQGRARRDSVYQGAHGKTHQALPRRGCGASSRKLIPSRAGYLAGSTQARRKRPLPKALEPSHPIRSWLLCDVAGTAARHCPRIGQGQPASPRSTLSFCEHDGSGRIGPVRFMTGWSPINQPRSRVVPSFL